MSVKVWLDGDTAQYHPASGVELRPGVNEVDDAKAVQLVTSGVARAATAAQVRAAEDAAAKAKTAAEAKEKKAQAEAATKADLEAKAKEESARAARQSLGLEAPPAPDDTVPAPAAAAAKKKE